MGLDRRRSVRLQLLTLVGREQERSELAAAVARAREGRGSLVLLAGEAGVGKTVLARAVLQESGLTVLQGASLQGGAPAYWALTTALPDLAGVTGADRAALCEVVVSAFAAAAPAAVFLDDLQWADEGTLDMLAVLAPALETQSLSVLGAYRSDEMSRGHPLRRLRSELRRQGRLHELTVEPLGAADTRALLRSVVGGDVAPSLVRTVVGRTGGLPFFIEELGAILVAEDRLRPGPGGLELSSGEDLPLPEHVRDAVLLRAAGLDGGVLAALSVAAAVGRSFDPELATAIAGVADWPEEPARRGIVTEDTRGRLAFRHDLVREAFYGEIGWAKRPALHRAIAEALEAGGAPASAIAEHWARGREPDRARRAYLAAADAFREVHAYGDGSRAIRRALELWPEGAEEPARLDALRQLGRSAELAGDLGGAVLAWREAAEGHRRDEKDRPLGEVLRSLAGALELQGRWEDALAAREQAASAFAAGALAGDAAGERLAAATHLRSAASFRAALALLETAKGEATAAQRPDLEARILALEGNVRARMGQGAPALELVRTGLTHALDHNLSGAAAEVYQRLADSLEHVGDYPGARETYDEALGFCAANELEPTAQLCLACLSVVLRHTGDWDSLRRRLPAGPRLVPGDVARPGGRVRDAGTDPRTARAAPAGAAAAAGVGDDRTADRARRHGAALRLGPRRARAGACARWRRGALPRDPRPLERDRGAPLRDLAAAMGGDRLGRGAGGRGRPGVRGGTGADRGRHRPRRGDVSARARARGDRAARRRAGRGRGAVRAGGVAAGRRRRAVRARRVAAPRGRGARRRRPTQRRRSSGWSPRTAPPASSARGRWPQGSPTTSPPSVSASSAVSAAWPRPSSRTAA